MFNSTRGFTVIEVMLALTLLSILAGIGIPALQKVIHGQQLRQASINLASALILARQEAIMRRRPVLLDNQDGDWTNGWHVYVDQNANGAFDSGELVLQMGEAIAIGIQISGNTPVNRYIRYMPTGVAKMQSGAFQAGTITLCHMDGTQAIRRLIISATGRLRTVKEAAGSC